MKVWITKYALTDGVEEREAELDERFPTMLTVRFKDYFQHFHGEGKEWHRTPEAAVVRAEEMRQAKIASLRKSIAKLEKLRFGAPAAPEPGSTE